MALVTYVAFDDLYADVDDTVVTLIEFGFLAADITLAEKAVIEPVDQALHIRLTGDAPTADAKHVIAAGTRYELIGKENLRQLKMCSATGTAAVFVTLYKL